MECYRSTNEGKIQKGGRNKPPTNPRPAKPPAGQRGKNLYKAINQQIKELGWQGERKQKSKRSI